MEKKIGTNKSSGAEKVDSIERRISAEQADPASAERKAPAKRTPAKSSAKRTPTQKDKKAHERAVKKEKKAAEERLDAAKKRAKEKEEKLEKKAAVKEKKIEKKAALKEKKLARRAAIAEKKAERKKRSMEKKAALKEKKAERRAERIARREMLKNELKSEKGKRTEREKRERAAEKRRSREAREHAREQKARDRRAAHARKAQDKKHRREQRTARKQNRKGYGGWLAAVVSLGVACLALGSVVTAGAFRMNDMQLAADAGYRAALYEMVSVSEEMDNDLAKLRVSAGADEQRRLLTDLLVESERMESSLGKIPVDAVTGTDISGFVNRTGEFARTMLSRLASGKTLSGAERETLARLYETNAALAGELNSLANGMTSDDVREFLKGQQGAMSEQFRAIGEAAKEAPFEGTGNVGKNMLSELEEVTSAEAEELAKKYFADYKIAEVVSAGETSTPDMRCYNFALTDENGAEFFAEITKRGGKLAFFDTYEPCTQKNLDLAACDAVAREYLEKIGIGNVEAVWLSDGGMVANLTYVASDGGVRAYPDMIRIRVCEEKGRVIGMDAKNYLVNHTERSYSTELSEGEARALLSEGLEVTASNRALIPYEGGDRLCYEFACSYGEEEYLVYLDAETGAELELLRVRESARGRYLD